MAQPPSKKQRASSSAAQPASSANKFIGFVSCPDTLRLDAVEGLEKIRRAIQDLMDLGAVFISVTCGKPGINMSNILQGVLPLADEMIENGVSVEQPDARPGYFCTDTSISFWSEKSFAYKRVDFDGGVAAHGFFFDTNAGKIAVFAASWPILPGFAKQRMLEAILTATGSDVPTTIVGGSLNDCFPLAENITSRMKTPLMFRVSGSLSLYASLSESASMTVQEVHTDGPHSVLAELIGSAEQPAAQPVPRPSSSTSEEYRKTVEASKL